MNEAPAGGSMAGDQTTWISSLEYNIFVLYDKFLLASKRIKFCQHKLVYKPHIKLKK
jgi:hypothetical protein